eukprot:scaffold133664_cov20-Tisochrysis_lutea.AAC.1
MARLSLFNVVPVTLSNRVPNDFFLEFPGERNYVTFTACVPHLLFSTNFSNLHEPLCAIPAQEERASFGARYLQPAPEGCELTDTFRKQ